MAEGTGAASVTDETTPLPDVDTEQRSGRRPRVPRFVLAVTALHIALMAMVSFLYPPFTGYDETWHVDMVVSYYNGNGVYGPGERLLDRGVEVAADGVQVPPPATAYSQAPTDARGDRGSFRDVNDGEATEFRQPNQMVQHPPLYYLTEAALLRLVPGSGNMPYDQQVWLLRLFSILMVAPLPVLCWATARRLVGDGAVALTAAAVPVTIPGLSRIGASVNNDNLLILLVGLLTVCLAQVVTGDLRRRVGLAVGVLATLALLTKGFALVLPVVVAAAYAVAWFRYRRNPLVPAGIAAGVMAVGAAWWVRNLVVHGAVQPDGVGDVWIKIIEGPERPGATVTDFVPKFFPLFTDRFWGGFGLIDDPKLAQWITTGWMLLLVAGLVAGVAYGIGGRWGRAAAAFFVLPALLVLAVILYGALSAYLYNFRLPGVQGRYLYPMLPGVVAVAALGWCRLARRWQAALPLAVLTAGLLTQAGAWKLLLDRWWAPRPSLGSEKSQLREALGGVSRWSPWPSVVTFTPFVLVVALSLLVLTLAARYLTRAVRPAAAPAEA